MEQIIRLYNKTLLLAQKEMEAVRAKDTLIAAAVVFVVVLLMCLILEKGQKDRIGLNNMLGYAIAGAYSIFIVELAICSREADSRDGIFANSMFASGLTEVEKIYVFLNVLFFVPFGIALASGMYHQMKFFFSLLLTTLATLGFSLIIEVTQRVTGRGYFEMADIEANTMGGLIGAVIGVAIGRAFYKKRVRRKQGKNRQ